MPTVAGSPAVGHGSAAPASACGRGAGQGDPLGVQHPAVSEPGQAGLWAGAGWPGVLDSAVAGGQAGGAAGGRLDCQGDGAADSKKNELQPWRQQTWCLKTAPDADFVCAMEAVLDTYQRPLDPRHPVVCVDELSKTLHAHVRAPRPPQTGRAARQDCEYKRHGHRNLFMMTAPCLGWRMVKVTRHRKRPDFAEILKELVDVHFPAAERITLVCDNLNFHKPSVLYSRYDAATAGHIRQKLQLVHTPKHASWLNVAASENSILIRQCLRRRIPDFDLRWQVVLGIEIEARPIAKSTLQLFRAQLILHDKVRAVFEQSLRLERETGYLPQRGMRVALDTTHILGRGAVKDTYNLLGDGIVQLLWALKHSPAFAAYRQLREVAEHRLARLTQLGMRQARCFGRAKTKCQL